MRCSKPPAASPASRDAGRCATDDNFYDTHRCAAAVTTLKEYPLMVIYDEEFAQVNAVIGRLLTESNARVIFLVDKNGQLITGVGETEHFDTTSLASLTAGNIAA